jgi:hypothetical protein
MQQESLLLLVFLQLVWRYRVHLLKPFPLPLTFLLRQTLVDAQGK